jgi:hypothetical protein
MNRPFCFDSIDLSNYSVFATIVSLCMSLLVSKLLNINDLIICILSVGSYMASLFCYIYATNSNFIYLGKFLLLFWFIFFSSFNIVIRYYLVFFYIIGAVVSSIAGLEYGYVRSIVSKSVDKSEVADALSLILIVDTIIAVVASVVFQVFYAHIVSQGVAVLFYFSGAFVLATLVIHFINYCLYKPVNQSIDIESLRNAQEHDNNKEQLDDDENENDDDENEANRAATNKANRLKKARQRRLLSLSETRLSCRVPATAVDREFDFLNRSINNTNPITTGDPVFNPLHKSLMLSSVDTIE